MFSSTTPATTTPKSSRAGCNSQAGASSCTSCRHTVRISTRSSGCGIRLLRSTSYDLRVVPAIAQFRLDTRMIATRLRRFIGDRLSLALPSMLLRFAIAAAELIFISALMQAGLALHGPALLSRHHHGNARQPRRHPAHTNFFMPAAAAAVLLGYTSTALARPPRLSLLVVGTRWHCGNRPSPRRCSTHRNLNRRPARSHALSRHDPRIRRRAVIGNARRSPCASSRLRLRRARLRRRHLDRIHPRSRSSIRPWRRGCGSRGWRRPARPSSRASR